MDWRVEAECQNWPHDLFFAHPYAGQVAKVCPPKDPCPRCTQALKVCEACPVVAECRTEVMRLSKTDDIAGVFGGMTVSQRQNRRRGEAWQRQKPPINHGTPGGYRAHKGRGEEACDSCKDANARRRRPAA